jgi:oligopeptide/dipeptide ABC transporter ATP-binding protein
MYAGKVVEYADVRRLFDDPRHPYTLGLFRSLPNLGERAERLEVIPGMVPKPQEFPTGCRFRNRCPLAEPICETEPPLLPIAEGHTVACHIAHRANKKG